MLSLIVFLLTLALMALLLLVTTNLLGESTTNNSHKARVAQILNESQQVMGALKVYSNDGHFIDHDFTLDKLVKNNYLIDIPKTQWDVRGRFLATDVNIEICIDANIKLGFKFKPSDENVYVDPDGKGVVPVCNDEKIEYEALCCYGDLS